MSRGFDSSRPLSSGFLWDILDPGFDEAHVLLSETIHREQVPTIICRHVVPAGRYGLWRLSRLDILPLLSCWHFLLRAPLPLSLRLPPSTHEKVETPSIEFAHPDRLQGVNP